MAELLPGICIMVGVYIVARILNYNEQSRRRDVLVKKEIDRRNRVNALYGRDK